MPHASSRAPRRRKLTPEMSGFVDPADLHTARQSRSSRVGVAVIRSACCRFSRTSAPNFPTSSRVSRMRDQARVNAATHR